MSLQEEPTRPKPGRFARLRRCPGNRPINGTSESSSFQRASAAGSKKALHVRASRDTTFFPPGRSTRKLTIRDVTSALRRIAGTGATGGYSNTELSADGGGAFERESWEAEAAGRRHSIEGRERTRWRRPAKTEEGIADRSARKKVPGKRDGDKKSGAPSDVEVA
jgi:hypothetical protein